MKQIDVDHSLFYHHSPQGYIYLIVYVDNIVLARNDNKISPWYRSGAIHGWFGHILKKICS